MGLFKKVAGVAAVAAAVALTGCDGGTPAGDLVASADPRDASHRVEAVADKTDRAGAPGSDGDRAARPREDGARSEDVAGKGGDQHARDGHDMRVALEGSADGSPESADGAELAQVVEWPASSDLEYSAGLPEPPQQTVVPPPPAWTPRPDVDSAKPIIEDVWPDKGVSSGGERVVIRGKNLRGGQILFGMAPARIIGESDEEVTVATPPEGAGEIAIVLTSRDGSYAIANGAFRYYN